MKQTWKLKSSKQTCFKWNETNTKKYIFNGKVLYWFRTEHTMSWCSKSVTVGEYNYKTEKYFGWDNRFC